MAHPFSPATKKRSFFAASLRTLFLLIFYLFFILISSSALVKTLGVIEELCLSEKDPRAGCNWLSSQNLKAQPVHFRGQGGEVAILSNVAQCCE